MGPTPSCFDKNPGWANCKAMIVTTLDIALGAQLIPNEDDGINIIGY